MFLFSVRSQDKLNTCCANLIRLFNIVIKRYDCTILCGRRDKQEQEKAYKEKRSKVRYPNSTHNRFPSRGVDVSPYPIPKNWGKISWELIPKKHQATIQKEIKELHKFYHFNGYVKGVADCNDISIRQGHDWDADNEFNDQSFDDLVHVETED